MITAVPEVERKYDTAADELPELTRIPGVARYAEARPVRLDAVYFDTDDLRLARTGVTLRARSGGDDAGWHLKVPAGLDTRTEFRAQLDGQRDQVPAELAALVLARTRGADLRPVATLCTHRTRTRLLDEHGTELAEVVLDEVTGTRTDDPEHPVSWTEIEVERLAGAPALLDTIEERLSRAGVRPARRGAKLLRVLPVPEPPAAPGRDATAGEVVLGYLRDQAAALTTADLGARVGAPDAVHQLRVAARRLRSALREYRAVFQDVRLSEELAWLGGELGGARDAEVQGGLLRQHLDELDPALVVGSVRADVEDYLAGWAARAEAAATAALGSRRYLDLLDALDDLVRHPELTALADQPAARVLPALHHHAVTRLRHRVRAVSHRPVGPDGGVGADRDTRVHRVRKAAKRARYAAEVLRPVLPRATRRFLAATTRMQDLLGEHNDAVVAMSLLRDLAEQVSPGGGAFTLGVLHERQAAIARERAAALDQVWHSAERAARRHT